MSSKRVRTFSRRRLLHFLAASPLLTPAGAAALAEELRSPLSEPDEVQTVEPLKRYRAEFKQVSEVLDLSNEPCIYTEHTRPVAGTEEPLSD